MPGTVFGPRLSTLEAQVLLVAPMDLVMGRQPAARSPASAIVPVINAATRIEVNVELGVIIVFVVGGVTWPAISSMFVNSATGGEQQAGSGEQAQTSTSPSGNQHSFHTLKPTATAARSNQSPCRISPVYDAADGEDGLGFFPMAESRFFFGRGTSQRDVPTLLLHSQPR